MESCAEPCGQGDSATEHEGSSSASSESGPRLGLPGPTHFWDYNDLHDLDTISQLLATARREHYDLWWEQEQERERNRPKYSNETPPSVGSSVRILTGIKALAEENPYRYEYRLHDQAWEPLRYHDPPEGEPVSRAAIFERALREGLEPAETAEDREFRYWERAMQGSHRNYGRTRVWKLGRQQGSGAQVFEAAGESYWAFNYAPETSVQAIDSGWHIEKDGGAGAWTQRCVMCQEIFHPKRSNAKTCSPRCRKRLSRANVTLRPKGEDEMQTAEIIRQLAAEDERSFQKRKQLVAELAARHPDSEIVQSAVDRFNEIALDATEEIAA